MLLERRHLAGPGCNVTGAPASCRPWGMDVLKLGLPGNWSHFIPHFIPHFVSHFVSHFVPHFVPHRFVLSRFSRAELREIQPSRCRRSVNGGIRLRLNMSDVKPLIENDACPLLIAMDCPGAAPETDSAGG
jgi:hypothetical protein